MIHSSVTRTAACAAVLFTVTACTDYKPFNATAPGGICNTAAEASANPQIRIDSDGTDYFVVTSILIKTGPQDQGAEGYAFLSVNSISIDGTRFDAITGNITDSDVGGWGINESADLLGTPIRRTPLGADGEKGGNFPHQIIADGNGPNDIAISLFCRADEYDLNIETILIAGWKQASDKITVTYVPGQ